MCYISSPAWSLGIGLQCFHLWALVFLFRGIVISGHLRRADALIPIEITLPTRVHSAGVSLALCSPCRISHELQCGAGPPSAAAGDACTAIIHACFVSLCRFGANR